MATNLADVQVDVVREVQPWEHIKVLCFTWNMGDAKPVDEELQYWLPSGGGEFDLVVVGVQECSYDWVSEWVTTPKRNPKRRKSLKGSGKTALPMLSGALEEGLHALENIAFGSPPESPERRKKVVRDVGEEAFSFHWDDILAERLGDGFTRVQQAVLMNMRLLVFAKTEYCDGTLQWQDGPLIHSVQHTHSATGLLAGTVGNKGGLVVTLHFGPVSLCFVSCHLAAHMSAAEKRNNDCREIIQETWPVCHPDLDIVTEFDHCFWFGDLNYRLDLSSEELPTLALGKRDATVASKDPIAAATTSRPDDFVNVCDMIQNEQYQELLKFDQLRQFHQSGKAFAGFQEGQPDFAPTFKVERMAGVSHQSERTPSYCDRILWKSAEAVEGNAVQRWLSSASEVSSSDHKPVYAHFDVRTPAARGSMLQRHFTEDGLSPVVKLTKLTIHSLPGSHANLRVVLFVLPLHENAVECKSEMSVTNQSTDLVWSQSLPTLRPAAMSQDELQSCTLLIVLYSKGNKMGSVGLRFPGDPSDTGERFQCCFDKPIVNKSSTFGTGRMSGSLEVDWSELAIKADNQNARSERSAPAPPEKCKQCCILQ